jgi:hypothetical protein
MLCSVCQTPYNIDDAALNYCRRCGWPLGRLEVTVQPERVVLKDADAETVTLTFRNTTHGVLTCRLGPLPPGLVPVQPLAASWTVSKKNPIVLQFKVVPSAAAGQKSLDVYVEVNDRYGAKAEVRGFRRDDLITLRLISIPLDYRTLGPIYALQDWLLFRRLHTEQILLLRNDGQVTGEVKLIAPKDYLLQAVGDLQGATELTVKIGPGGSTEAVTVIAPPIRANNPAAPAILRVEGKGIEGGALEVRLGWINDPVHELPRERWLIGIDFGTAKTAVFVIDRRARRDQDGNGEATPQAITWYEIGRTEQVPHQKVPSVILYPTGGGKPQFGYAVPENPRPTDIVVHSIKKRLSEERKYKIPTSTGGTKSVTAQDIVTDFMSYLIDNILKDKLFLRSDGEMEDPFTSARVVLSLPVLDRDEQGRYGKQEKFTLEAARNSGLDNVRIDCHPEPECAMIDFMRRQQDFDMNVRDGDLVLVFDSGAGTTDISVQKVTFPNGKPQFEPRALVGFPVGGDLVDHLLTEELLRRFPDITKKAAYDRREVLLEIRKVKETLSLRPEDAATTSRPVILPGLEIKENDFMIDWNLIAGLYEPFLEGMLHKGLSASEIPDWENLGRGNDATQDGQAAEPETEHYPSLDTALFEARPRINLREVNWICLTGGTSFIPAVRDALQTMFGARARIRPSADQLDRLLQQQVDAPFTLNVAQGAAMHPLFRFEGQLPIGFAVECRSRRNGRLCDVKFEDKSTTLTLIARPGDRRRFGPFIVMAGDEVEISVFALIGTETKRIYRLWRANPESGDREIDIELHYDRDQQLHLTESSDIQAIRESPVKDLVILS